MVRRLRGVERLEDRFSPTGLLGAFWDDLAIINPLSDALEIPLRNSDAVESAIFGADWNGSEFLDAENTCRAELTPLDERVGPRVDPEFADDRFSGASPTSVVYQPVDSVEALSLALIDAAHKDASDPPDTIDELPPDVNATAVQVGGEIAIPVGSMVFISDDTTFMDDWAIWSDAPSGTPILEGIGDWEEIAEILQTVPDGSLESIVVSGHGADGGVQTADGQNLEADNLPLAVAELIDRKLADDGTIIILACTQADADDAANMQELAVAIGHPVIGNSGEVNSGTNGEGTWIEFDPLPVAP